MQMYSAEEVAAAEFMCFLIPTSGPTEPGKENSAVWVAKAQLDASGQPHNTFHFAKPPAKPFHRQASGSQHLFHAEVALDRELEACAGVLNHSVGAWVGVLRAWPACSIIAVLQASEPVIQVCYTERRVCN